MQLAFVLYQGLTALDLVGPLEVLSRLPGSEVVLVGSRSGQVTTDNGALRLLVPQTLDTASSPDVVVVPGGAAGTRAAMGDTELLEWLRAVAPGAQWVSSVCTGALVLGAAGLLEGRHATTHWAFLERLRDHGAFPRPERVVVDGSVVTAAGVSAGIDMALGLAARLGGRRVARTLQLAIEYDPQPPFDAGRPDGAGRATAAVARAAVRRAFEGPAPSPATMPSADSEEAARPRRTRPGTASRQGRAREDSNPRPAE